MMKPVIPALLALTCMTNATSAGETREHGAHAHGIGTLNIVTEANELLIEWISPSANIVGFEYLPVTEEEKEAVEQAENALGQVEDLFEFPAGAQCRVEHIDVESLMLGEHDEHEGDEQEDEAHHDEHEGEEAHAEHDGESHDDEHENDSEIHSEFHVTYEFACSDMDKLTEMNVNVFKVFPLTESLNAQIVSASGQTRKTLDKDDTILKF